MKQQNSNPLTIKNSNDEQTIKSFDAVIIDTGCANINSLKFALERLGYAIEVTSVQARIKSAKKIFLPGVGSAEYAMQGINERSLGPLIKELKQPVLGICLGMQLMTEHSVENKVDTPCLNLIPGDIKRISKETTSTTDTIQKSLRLPHMGWNTLTHISNSPLFTDISEKDYFYFVHSYCAPVNDNTLAQCNYGQAFSASLSKDNFYGVQFHPERSGKSGAKLLKNFMELCS